MSQITAIYNSQQWNEKVQSLRSKDAQQVQEVMLPLNNIAQKNPIYITNTKTHRLDETITDGIPQNIMFNFKNSGFFNVYNSNFSFNLPIHISNLPRYNKDTQTFDFKFSNDIYYEIPNVADELQASNIKSIQYNIILYNNYICLSMHVSGSGTYLDDADVSHDVKSQGDILIRLYQIPPSPAAYLDNCLLQKNNKSDNAFNSYYQDIFRKVAINNQLIEQNYCGFNQSQYAYVNNNQNVIQQLYDATTEIETGLTQIKSQKDEIQLLASYISTKDNPITDITYNYQISIPICMFHQLFQLQYNMPMELLNSEIQMIFNFNMPIFSACFAYYKSFEAITPEQYINNMINVSLEGINDMKIILYKDNIMNYKTIEKSKDGIYYLVYRNSDKAQYQSFSKTDNIVLQNLLPKLNSLDIIQISFFDKQKYGYDFSTKRFYQYNSLDWYLGYSSLFNPISYTSFTGSTYIQQGASVQFFDRNMFDITINSDVTPVVAQSDNKIQMISLGDLQMSIDDVNIIPYTYQTLEDYWKTNMSLYDIQDTQVTPSKQWEYPFYLRYFNTYFYKFDAKYGNKEQLAQADFQGMTVSDAKSNIICRLYDYCNNGEAPHQITGGDFDDNGFYKQAGWLDTPVFVEFIYFYSSLFVINGGDLLMASEQSTARLLKNIPRFNYAEMKLAESIPVIKEATESDLRKEFDEKLNALKAMMEMRQPQQVLGGTTQVVTQQPQGQDANVVIEPKKEVEAVPEPAAQTINTFRQGGLQKRD